MPEIHLNEKDRQLLEALAKNLAEVIQQLAVLNRTVGRLGLTIEHSSNRHR